MDCERLNSPVLSFVDINGRPLVGGKLYTYEAGTSTLATTYRDIDGTEANENPILLDGRGECVCFLDCEKTYKIVLKDAHDCTIWEQDNVLPNNIYGLQLDISRNDQRITDIENGKADKVSGATNNHLAVLDSEGNLKDSGHGADDFATSAQGDKADSALQPGDIAKLVRVDSDQTFNDTEKARGRKNIGAVNGIVSGADWPIDSQDLAIFFVNFHFDLFLFLYEGNSDKRKYFSLIEQLQPSDYGKIPFSSAIDAAREGEPGEHQKFVMRYILENCSDRDAVKLALQRGQVPIAEESGNAYIPYMVSSDGSLLLNNRFGVKDKNPMTGDALGRSLVKRKGDGAVYDQCLWGKPYGINYFEIGKYKCNDNYHLGLSNENRMVWRRVPMDRPLTITGIGIVGNGDTINKTLMNGIFEYDGNTLTKVSDATTWSVTQGYINSQENVVRLDYMIDNNSGDFDFALFSFTSPVVLKEGYNYLIPSRYNNSHTYNDPYICTYKKASPAMPWEDLVSANAENGDPVMSTARAGCKPSALMLTLSDGTEMWI